jgi:4-hydroxybenzoate polyprenyltransferase
MHFSSVDHPRWWQWPTVLSLDAPAVALVWQLLLARVAPVPLRWPQVTILSSSVWLAYVLDRWIEAWRLPAGQLLTKRHAFYKRWRWPVAILWVTFLAGDLIVAWTQLTRREWAAGVMLLGPVVLYLLSHQWIHRRRAWRVPKEICIAALFGAGVALFLVAPAPRVLPVLALPLALFTSLCFLNCVLISKWEREVDRLQGQTSLALQYRRADALVGAMLWLLAAAALVLAVVAPGGGTRSVFLCALASCAILGIVDTLQRRLGWQAARVLADAALLTPLVPLAAGWLL